MVEQKSYQKAPQMNNQLRITDSINLGVAPNKNQNADSSRSVMSELNQLFEPTWNSRIKLFLEPTPTQNQGTPMFQRPVMS